MEREEEEQRLLLAGSKHNKSQHVSYTPDLWLCVCLCIYISMSAHQMEREEEEQRLLPAGSKHNKSQHISYTPALAPPGLKEIYEEESRCVYELQWCCSVVAVCCSEPQRFMERRHGVDTSCSVVAVC